MRVLDWPGRDQGVGEMLLAIAATAIVIQSALLALLGCRLHRQRREQAD